MILWSWNLQWFFSLSIAIVLQNFRFFAFTVMLLQAFQCPILTYLWLAFYRTYKNWTPFIMQLYLLALHQYQHHCCAINKNFSKKSLTSPSHFVSNFSFAHILADWLHRNNYVVSLMSFLVVYPSLYHILKNLNSVHFLPLFWLTFLWVIFQTIHFYETIMCYLWFVFGSIFHTWAG